MLRAETFNWEMDLFALSSLSNSRPLTAITYNAFKVSSQKQGLVMIPKGRGNSI